MRSKKELISDLYEELQKEVMMQHGHITKEDLVYLYSMAEDYIQRHGINCDFEDFTEYMITNLKNERVAKEYNVKPKKSSASISYGTIILRIYKAINNHIQEQEVFNKVNKG